MTAHLVKRIILVVLAMSSLSLPARSQGKPDIVVFDEDDPIGVGYFDASFGMKSGSTLTLAGPGNDKLIISTTHYYTGVNGGLLEWKSVVGGSWRLFVASIGWATKDASGYDSIAFYVNSRSAIPAGDLPKVGLESSTNIKTPDVNIETYLSGGTDADTTTWERVSIPLNAFEPYGGFSLSNVKDVNFSQGSSDDVGHTMWFDNIRIISKAAVVDTTVPTAPKGPIAHAGDRSVILHWDRNTETNLAGYSVYRSTGPAGPFSKVTSNALGLQSFADLDVVNGTSYYFFIRALNSSLKEGDNSDTVHATPAVFSDSMAFLDYVERAAFEYFWYEANPDNGLIRDRSEVTSAASIAAVGFGLTAYGIGVDRGWISRVAARDRTLTTLKTFWTKPQGPGATGTIGYKGWFYHFLEMGSAVRAGSSELSSIDTGLLLAGILYVKEYFDGADSTETGIRALADSILDRVDWNWMTNGAPSLTMGWSPEGGFISARWIGYNEAMILNLMGMGVPNNPLPPEVWNSWTSGYRWQMHYGYSFVNFPPLFGHQYSHCWVDFRTIADTYMRSAGITYAENTRRATLAQRAYCIANPSGFTGYGENVWGLTACDGPGSAGYFGYIARGTPPPENDDGTIAPTAAGGSMPFAPEICLPALQYMYDQYRATIWTGYGFRDAFNLKANWWDPDVIGIDQGPIVLMAENYRSGSVWNKMMANTVIENGLQRAGFTPVTSVETGTDGLPLSYALDQNYPNPFNPLTTIRFALPKAAHVSVQVFDLLGRKAATLVNEPKDAGVFTVSFDARHLSTGVYYYNLRAGGITLVKKMVVLK